MMLSPEGVAAVVRQINTEAMAENVCEQLGFDDMTGSSFDSLHDGIIDAVTEVLAGLSFEPES